MPPDNAATVAVGSDVSFPRNGINSGSGIARLSNTAFSLNSAGVYLVHFQVSVEQAGQLQLTLNGTPLPFTTVGRATGANQIVGMALVQTSQASILTVRNPAGNAAALEIVPNSGGASAVSANLLIVRLQ